MSICVYLYVYIHTHIYTHKYNVDPFSSWAQTPKTISWRVNKMNHILVLQCSELTWDSLGSKVTGLSMVLCHRTQQARGRSSRRIFLYYCRMMHPQAVWIQVNLYHILQGFFFATRLLFTCIDISIIVMQRKDTIRQNTLLKVYLTNSSPKMGFCQIGGCIVRLFPVWALLDI